MSNLHNNRNESEDKARLEAHSIEILRYHVKHFHTAGQLTLPPCLLNCAVSQSTQSFQVVVMLGTLTCAGSGLSSSAAIVCASALAVLGYYGVSVDKGVSTCLSSLSPVCRLWPLQFLCPSLCCRSGLPSSIPDSPAPSGTARPRPPHACPNHFSFTRGC